MIKIKRKIALVLMLSILAITIFGTSVLINSEIEESGANAEIYPFSQRIISPTDVNVNYLCQGPTCDIP